MTYSESDKIAHTTTDRESDKMMVEFDDPEGDVHVYGFDSQHNLSHKLWLEGDDVKTRISTFPLVGTRVFHKTRGPGVVKKIVRVPRHLADILNQKIMQDNAGGMFHVDQSSVAEHSRQLNEVCLRLACTLPAWHM